MEPIGLALYLRKLSCSAIGGIRYQSGYLKDKTGTYHKISEVDLLRDRICCDDGHWSCYEWIEQDERTDEHELFIEG